MTSLIPPLTNNRIPATESSKTGAVTGTGTLPWLLKPKPEPDQEVPDPDLPFPDGPISAPASKFKFSSHLDFYLGLSSNSSCTESKALVSGLGAEAKDRIFGGKDGVGKRVLGNGSLRPECRALVVAPPRNEVAFGVAGSGAVAVKPAKKPKRSGEMMRTGQLGMDLEWRFRAYCKAVRMLYDGLRVSPMLNAVDRGVNTRKRADLKAGSLMLDKNLWMYRDKRLIGPIPGVYVGDIFFYWMELCVVGLHGQTQAGIDFVLASQSGNGEPIATSIVYSGGYEGDEDLGDVIIYSGHGGKGRLNKPFAHQKLEGGNLALEKSKMYGIELRVIRGIKIGKGLSRVYVYDGLYKVVQSWFAVEKSGFGVFKFKLVREPGQPCLGSVIVKLAEDLKANPLSVRPTGYISLDLSSRKENVPVHLYNDVDNCSDPMSIQYLPKTVFPPQAFQQTSSGSGCSCVSVCGQDCLCAIKNGGEFPYDQNGILVKWKPVVFECGTFCKCPPSCRNRVSQLGLKTHLEVFRSKEGGWGVRSLDLIHVGAFICEYAGVVLTKEQAAVFALDTNSLVYPNKFVYRQTTWGDLSRVFPNSVKPTYPSLPPFDFAIDISRMRNVGTYIRQSSSPNTMVQLVIYSHSNLYFPHLMIFSLENISPVQELTLDYGLPEQLSDLHRKGQGRKLLEVKQEVLSLCS